ncbi:MBL fold metallo-hydrolase [Limibaculum sp. FT325]|uniref:MBL fold metallo-hydrolase RNA specificity domain-containing protein n=1 Tax=Thermohalobaculum sediminis TaxID=2939436 RepID=UPI0020BDB3E4|nr:MBL fold metallo-hydrolase [Limibaculum sediminis]MCL5779025.1 MBL fold metallo-hydrolase [Limibaculum sediminis]
MEIAFHGAARQVTGSCHLVTCAGTRILIDCGIFQGGHELDEDNAAPFGFEPPTVDFLLLTHAHLDHCGRLPLLVRRGFDGEVIATAPTRELARLVLLDAGKLQEEEAKRWRKRGRAAPTADGPLYDTLDVLNAFDRFGRTARYGTRIQLREGIAATFFDAGHILGSASILLELTERGQTRRVLFSGDLGGRESPLFLSPEPPGPVDAVVMETTYGDRDHRSRAASVAELYGAIRATLERGGNVVIPSFAMERAQEILFHLGEGKRHGKVPKTLQVFLDSPMAISATEIFRRHPDAYRHEIAQIFAAGHDPFELPGLHLVSEAGESAALNQIRSGALILAGSGMCTGGRIRHHLRHNLPHADCSVVFVGFAAEGTLARRIIDGAQKVRIFGDEVPVRARIHTINGFSAHADASELRAWHARLGGPGTTFLVHGEPSSMTALAEGLGTGAVVMPAMHEAFEI